MEEGAWTKRGWPSSSLAALVFALTVLIIKAIPAIEVSRWTS